MKVRGRARAMVDRESTLKGAVRAHDFVKVRRAALRPAATLIKKVRIACRDRESGRVYGV